jgi:hypothetical protein
MISAVLLKASLAFFKSLDCGSIGAPGVFPSLRGSRVKIASVVDKLSGGAV